MSQTPTDSAITELAEPGPDNNLVGSCSPCADHSTGCPKDPTLRSGHAGQVHRISAGQGRRLRDSNPGRVVSPNRISRPLGRCRRMPGRTAGSGFAQVSGAAGSGRTRPLTPGCSASVLALCSPWASSTAAVSSRRGRIGMPTGVTDSGRRDTPRRPPLAATRCAGSSRPAGAGSAPPAEPAARKRCGRSCASCRPLRVTLWPAAGG